MKRQWLGAAVVAACVGGAGPVLAQEPADPLEPLNRAMFEWNLVAYDRVLVPAARYYRDATTAAEREAIRHFLTNLRAPMVAANQLLQGDRERAGITLHRFAINSTVGLLGLFDPATDWGYPTQMPEDFGQTLAAYGVPDGPYLVLPLVGPCTARDALGRVGDYLALDTYLDTEALNLVLGAMAVSDAEPDLERHAAERTASLDLYAKARSAYAQRRAAAIRNGSPPADEIYDGIFRE